MGDPTIGAIVGNGKPYKTISKVHLKLNSNATSVQSNLGYGTLRLLQLTVYPAVYATLSATAFIALVNPGAKPTIPSIASVPHITNLCYAHDVATVVFKKYNRTNKALRKMLISSVEKMFIRSLCHLYVGYGTTTTHTILDHLYATYVNILSANLQDNDSKICAPYNANFLIEALINQVKGAVKYAAARNTPYTPL